MSILDPVLKSRACIRFGQMERCLLRSEALLPSQILIFTTSTRVEVCSLANVILVPLEHAYGRMLIRKCDIHSHQTHRLNCDASDVNSIRHLKSVHLFQIPVRMLLV